MGLFGNKQTSATTAPLAEYKVVYRGGLPHLPKAKVAGIELRYWPDRLTLDPTSAAKKFWDPLSIPYGAISDLTIEQRQVSTAESLLASGSRGGIRDLATHNNIHLAYSDPTGQPMLLRVEMLTGVTVSGQAKKCAEMLDMIRVHGIRDHFATPSATTTPAASGSVADELAKLGQLMQQGILSADEFAAAKARLLGQ
ncbi:SHOCT domain-containing protein [Streptacidiphilus sp. N1-10]|uniref:SHOCT domain-containing protein n=1 Tax=Streptacidiphilus jeojiensis TaxID=3229225 RepID=A0ABV6XLL0_9ACTN